MQGRTQPIDRDLAECAADWLLLLHNSAGDPVRAAALQRCIDDWCAERPAHATAFARAERAWQMAKHLPAKPAMAPIPLRRPIARRPIAAAAGAMMAAAAAVIVLLPTVAVHWQADYLTSTGGLETARLEDGSVVTLAADSAISSSFTATGRHVALLRGEAYFDVAHDAARPFIIDAGDTEIKVLGTAFDIDLTDDALNVAVARGRVAVRATDAEEVILQAGQAITIDRASNIGTQGPAPVDQIAAWRQGQFIVDDATIGEIVAKLDHYHPGLLFVADADLAAKRVTGVFDLYDPDKALRALADAQGGRLVSLATLVTAMVAAD